MDWFRSPWQDVALVAASTAAFYVTTLVGVRVAGRRTLTELSAFDVVVTIALGSLLATTVVAEEPAYANGVAALVTLLALQMALGFVRRGHPTLRRLVEFEPEVVYRDGELRLGRSPLGAQLTEDELWTALRRRGVFDRATVSMVVLEPSGQISVVPVDSETDDQVVPW